MYASKYGGIVFFDLEPGVTLGRMFFVFDRLLLSLVSNLVISFLVYTMYRCLEIVGTFTIKVPQDMWSFSSMGKHAIIMHNLQDLRFGNNFKITIHKLVLLI